MIRIVAILPLVLFAATFCFALGISQPLLRVERLLFFSDEPNLLEVVSTLAREGDLPLAIIVGLFSIGFPALKLVLLHRAAYARGAPIPKWLPALSNWSMLDVVLVALVIFAAKTSGLADAASRAGLWFFAASSLLTALASALIRKD